MQTNCLFYNMHSVDCNEPLVRLITTAFRDSLLANGVIIKTKRKGSHCWKQSHFNYFFACRLNKKWNNAEAETQFPKHATLFHKQASILVIYVVYVIYETLQTLATKNKLLWVFNTYVYTERLFGRHQRLEKLFVSSFVCFSCSAWAQCTGRSCRTSSERLWSTASTTFHATTREASWRWRKPSSFTLLILLEPGELLCPTIFLCTHVQWRNCRIFLAAELLFTTFFDVQKWEAKLEMSKDFFGWFFCCVTL